jgi:hypothetical protein
MAKIVRLEPLRGEETCNVQHDLGAAAGATAGLVQLIECRVHPFEKGSRSAFRVFRNIHFHYSINISINPTLNARTISAAAVPIIISAFSRRDSARHQ